MPKKSRTKQSRRDYKYRGPRQAAVRMEDVALLAGVSVMTVSRVVGNPDQVSERTRSKVLGAMRRTGYIRNRIAGSLASKRSHVVALIIPIMDPVFADMVRGMTSSLRQEGYETQLSVSDHSTDIEEREIEAFLGRRVDAIATVGYTHTKRCTAFLRRTSVPVAEVWNVTRKPIELCIGISHYRASRAMVRFLFTRGYRRIAYMGGFPLANDRTSDRERGFIDEMRALKLPMDGHRIVRRQFYLAEGASGLRELLAKNNNLDAIYAGSDMLAAGALFEAQRMGIDVPKKLAIAGFDDADLARSVVPSLTTVKMPRYEIGVRAAEQLLERIHVGRGKPQVSELGFEIVIRGST